MVQFQEIYHKTVLALLHQYHHQFFRLYKIIDVHKVYERMDRLFKKQDYNSSHYVGTITGAYNIREIVPKEYFGDYSEASQFLFHDMTIKGPAMVHEYLTRKR